MARLAGPTYNPIVMAKYRDPGIALIGSILLAGLTLVPYGIAQSASAPSIFGGFLLNPIDGYSYLAKMGQGLRGEWLFKLPYAAEPGPGVVLFSFYLLLGQISRWFGANPILVFHAARCLMSIGMYWSIYFLFASLMPSRRSVWLAFSIAAVGTGVGWMAIPFGVLANDLWIPESIPLLSAYANPHFPLATGLLAGAILVVVNRSRRLWLRIALGVLLGFVLAVVQPFAVLSIGAVLVIWLLLEGRTFRLDSRRFWSGVWSPPGKVVVGFLAGATPVACYDLWISRFHPVISSWSQQNLTPTPPLLETFLGYGFIFPLALLGIAREIKSGSKFGRLLITWTLVTSVLLYSPFPLQRRLTLGLFLPLAALAALGLEGFNLRLKIRNLLAVLLILLSLPSHLIVMAAGISGVQQDDPKLVISLGQADAYKWLDSRPGAPLVLAGPITGNQLPAYTSVRVLFGHPFETPHAAEKLETIESIYNGSMAASLAYEVLQDLGVQYIFVGPQEREIGEPGWLRELRLVFQNETVTIYTVEAE